MGGVRDGVRGGRVKLDANCQLCFNFFRQCFPSFRKTAREREREKRRRASQGEGGKGEERVRQMVEQEGEREREKVKVHESTESALTPECE